VNLAVNQILAVCLSTNSIKLTRWCSCHTRNIKFCFKRPSNILWNKCIHYLSQNVVGVHRILTISSFNKVILHRDYYYFIIIAKAKVTQCDAHRHAPRVQVLILHGWCTLFILVPLLSTWYTLLFSLCT
jgi:hypothetical protein